MPSSGRWTGTRARWTPRPGSTEILQRVKRLTPRETEVFALVVTGMLNKQIAAAIGVGEGTVKVHRARVMAKMHAGSLAELVRLADAVGVIVPKT